MQILKFKGEKEVFEKLQKFLEEVDKDFLPPLSSKGFERICENPTIENYLKELTENGAVEYATGKGEIIGFTGYYINYPKYGGAFLENISVKKNLRCKGIGTELMEACLKNLKEKGATQVFVRTWSTNKASLKLYKNFGFQVIEVLKNDRKEGVDTVKFRKELK